MALSRPAGWCSRTAKLVALGCALLIGVLSAPEPLLAQAAPRVASFQAKVDEAARTLADEPLHKGLSAQERQAIVEFVVGNMLFVAVHEMGHAVIGEMEMPVLGREEDAADSFATLTILKLGTDFSHRVLIESAKGWFLSNLRDDKKGEMLPYYDEHSMDVQRAYQIVCFMVGSDPEKFKELADLTKLPQERQTSCKRDYGNTIWSWETMLKPHSRPADQPKQKIEVIYGDGKGKLEVYGRLFRDIRFLETIAEHLADRFAWPRPFVMEMRSCGDSNAHWSGKTRKLDMCYELAQEFAQLYRDYGKELKLAKGKKQG